MERAVAMLYKDGLVRRHLRKALKVYRERRDHFCDILSSDFADYMDFQEPEGGLAVWTRLKNVEIDSLRKAGLSQKILIPDELSFASKSQEFNAMRLGFASMNFEESEALLSKLKDVFSKR